jgi:hypothetical protein
MKEEIGGWSDRRIIYWFKQRSFAREIMRFLLKSVGLKNLRFNWRFPRPSIAFIRHRVNNKKLTGVEIGTNEGLNAESILKTLNIETLYLIDPFEEYVDINTKQIKDRDLIKNLKYEEKDMNKIEIKCRKRLKNKQVIFIKKESNEAINDVPNNLDFVYIDGNHTYEYVKDDLNNYWGKLRQGGFLCGHDCFFPNMGVQKAVFEFAIDKNFFHFGIDDWLIIKK